MMGAALSEKMDSKTGHEFYCNYLMKLNDTFIL